MNILLCTCEYFHAVGEQTVSAVRAALDAAGVAVLEVDDLCGLAARCDRRLALLAGAEHSAVIACYPRAVTWMFAAAGAALNDGHTELLNMHEQSPEEIARRVSAAVSPEAGPAGTDAHAVPAAETHPIPPDWKPWFPILDYDRCVECGQCMDFCLFGVYDVDGDGRVFVRNPDNCKTNCPACARICPEAAIMFPKHAEAPINGDQPGPDADGVARVDISEALGPNLYATLRSRSKGQRFAPADSLKQAETERCQCAGLQAIMDKLSVPREVIESVAADRGSSCSCQDPSSEIGGGADCECPDSPPEAGAAGADGCCDGQGHR